MSQAEHEADLQAIKEIEAAIMARKPANAKALIVAEYHENESDLQTDYHNHQTTRRVAIGWRTTARESFKQLRKAAATFPDTAHLGPGCDIFYVIATDADGFQRYVDSNGQTSFGNKAEFPTEAAAIAFIAEHAVPLNRWGLTDPHAERESIEHRENYSMGAGNYIKAGHRNSTGWSVQSYSLEYGFGSVIEYDRLPQGITGTNILQLGDGTNEHRQ